MAEILARLTDALDHGLNIGFRATWRDGVRGGRFLVFPDKKTVSFEPYANSPTVEGDSGIMALGWYLDFLLPIMEPFGIDEYKATDTL